ncbi:MAG TPA: DUF2939 domain-containing protein [Microvirga sp.]|nr:DUF2939 domain-containing protein [Microvirga sp.]
MIWTFRITLLLFVAWIVFLVSPFVALYDLTKAVEAKDAARIAERVNFRAVRISLTQQIVGTYLTTKAGQQAFGDLDRRAATSAGAAIVNPLVEQLVTPEALIDLLEDGWPQQAAGNGGRAARAAVPTPTGIDFGSFGEAVKVFLTSEGQGFRSVTIPLPPDTERDKQFRFTMRLSGMTWRLTGIDLPKALRQELIRRAPKTTSLSQ